MADKRQKDPQFVTPAGTFIFPKLGEPDTKFKAEGEYSVKVRMPMKDAQPLLDQLEPLYQDALEAGRKGFAELPIATRKKLKAVTENPLYNLDYDENENETGDIIFKFGMAASGVSQKTQKPWTRRPGVFDAARRPLDGSKVWGGTVGKVAFTTRPYFVKGTGACGLSLKLEAVQVLDLVSGGTRSAASYGFDEEEGYVHSDEPVSSSSEHAEGEDGDGDF